MGLRYEMVSGEYNNIVWTVYNCYNNEQWGLIKFDEKMKEEFYPAKESYTPHDMLLVISIIEDIRAMPGKRARKGKKH